MEERLMRLLREVVYILKRIGPKTEPCGTPQLRGSEEERLGGMKQLICGNDRYEVIHCRGSSEMPNQVVVKGVEGGREIEMAKETYLLMGDSICEMVM